MAAAPHVSQQRTYWHLGTSGRVPSDYDIGTTALLYYPERGFEVDTPGADWYRRYQRGWWLAVGGHPSFRDPRETTYSRYTELQETQEAYVGGLLRSIEETPYDRQLPRAWLSRLEDWLPVLRYPCHALQMLAAYVGQIAPSSRVVVACCFQAGDEMRRIQRIAYRMRQLQEVRSDFGAQSKEAWQRAPHWQPLRAVIERLLVTFDGGAAFVGLNLVLKPMFDRLFMLEFAHLAEQNEDPLLGRILAALGDDCRWHRQWARALVRTSVDGDPAIAEAIEGELSRWHEATHRALRQLEPLWASETRAWSVVQEELSADVAAFWESAGLRAAGVI